MKSSPSEVSWVSSSSASTCKLKDDFLVNGISKVKCEAFAYPSLVVHHNFPPPPNYLASFFPNSRGELPLSLNPKQFQSSRSWPSPFCYWVSWVNRMAEQYDQYPWMLAGDFNDFMNLEDRRSFRNNTPIKAEIRRRAERFAANLNRCGLIDLGCCGPRLTWTNGREGLANTLVRLDRALANEKWKELFPEATVRNIPLQPEITALWSSILKVCILPTPLIVLLGVKPYGFHILTLVI